MKKVINIRDAKQTIEGAGVKLWRAFGFYEKGEFDPFLLLDHFGSKDSNDYIKGFPWHPHRGIETVTYMLSGSVEHKDSLGNSGSIKTGDVQWMSAGSGIIHQEMPQYNDDRLDGFQLWINLPKDHKMIKPRYREIISAEIKSFETIDGVIIKVIAGEYDGVVGPVKDLIVECKYFDVTIPEKVNFVLKCDDEMRYFSHVFQGTGYICDHPQLIGSNQTIALSDGDEINITSHGSDLKLLIIAGRELKENIAWRGPIVMNTEYELDQAFEEYSSGRFIQNK